MGVHSTLGQRIAQARLTAGARRGKAYTQTELGKAVGVTPATVSQWEAGASEPPLATIRKIAAALNVAAGYLAFGEESITQPAPSDTFGLQRSPGRTVDEALADFTPESSRAIGGKKRGKG